jgi:hypothetical protein
MLPGEERAGDAAGPEIDALAGVIGDVRVDDDVGDLQPPARSEHTVDLGDHGVFVGDEVDDAGDDPTAVDTCAFSRVDPDVAQGCEK